MKNQIIKSEVFGAEFIGRTLFTRKKRVNICPGILLKIVAYKCKETAFFKATQQLQHLLHKDHLNKSLNITIGTKIG